MLSNLNEKYLLKFISRTNEDFGKNKSSLFELLDSLGVKIPFSEENPVYDIITKLENCGICYE